MLPVQQTLASPDDSLHYDGRQISVYGADILLPSLLVMVGSETNIHDAVSSYPFVGFFSSSLAQCHPHAFVVEARIWYQVRRSTMIVAVDIASL